MDQTGKLRGRVLWGHTSSAKASRSTRPEVAGDGFSVITSHARSDHSQTGLSSVNSEIPSGWLGTASACSCLARRPSRTSSGVNATPRNGSVFSSVPNSSIAVQDKPAHAGNCALRFLGTRTSLRLYIRRWQSICDELSDVAGSFWIHIREHGYNVSGILTNVELAVHAWRPAGMPKAI
jgi:hypothetical protein